MLSGRSIDDRRPAAIGRIDPGCDNGDPLRPGPASRPSARRRDARVGGCERGQAGRDERRRKRNRGLRENVWVDFKVDRAESRTRTGFHGFGQGLRIWHDLSMSTPKKSKRLLDAYRFAGFRPVATLRGVFGDSHARVVRLVRRSKKRSAGRVVGVQSGWYDRRLRRVRDLSCGAWRIYLELEVRRLWCRSSDLLT